MGGSTLPLAPDAFSGRKLGKYEVLCRLSTGGMAEIFLASQRGLAGFRKLVVLKQILPDIKGEEEFVQMFLDEARVTAAFNHPHIAQVFDLDVADGELFLAMEFVPGATLVEVAKACRAANEPIPIGLGLAAARDTALALHYAHTFTDPLGRPTSVIHRDVAEKNIMVTYEGVTKLLDFGIAKNLARKGRTQIGMVKGTSGYMSPEQILGERLDARSDLFSLGVVLHECLTGLRLFHAKTPAEGAGAVLHGQVPPPSQANRAVPPELDAVVLKALARKREDRYASTLEFARALERAAGPLIWHPEQSGELIRRFFEDRREQTRKLLMAEQAMSGEASGEVNLSQLIANSVAQQAPQLPPEPDTKPVLPQITSALPPAPRPSRLSMAAVPSAKPPPPPPQEEPQARPPTPPRGAATRRSTSTGIPAVTPPEGALRRPVFEPLPQKRTMIETSNEIIPPPPPVDELTGRTGPGGDELTGRTGPGGDELTGRT
ncbi:MAG: protein kinase, partial [Myxococcaceae bacterium]|nr:protein kinase [Myxococcaceae bacterium]